jgi:hypothetical protein
MQDTADAIGPVSKRNPPYPAVSHEVDTNIAVGNRWIALGSLEMREERYFPQVWQQFALSQRASEQR